MRNFFRVPIPCGRAVAALLDASPVVVVRSDFGILRFGSLGSDDPILVFLEEGLMRFDCGFVPALANLH